jgi:hypothetical protein
MKKFPVTHNRHIQKPYLAAVEQADEGIDLGSTLATRLGLHGVTPFVEDGKKERRMRRTARIATKQLGKKTSSSSRSSEDDFEDFSATATTEQMEASNKLDDEAMQFVHDMEAMETFADSDEDDDGFGQVYPLDFDQNSSFDHETENSQGNAKALDKSHSQNSWTRSSSMKFGADITNI